MHQIPASKGACTFSAVLWSAAALRVQRLSCLLRRPLSRVLGKPNSVLNAWSGCLCRKAFQLLRELVRQCPQDIREAVKQGLFATLACAIRSNLADVREASLALLALLVQHPGVVIAAKQASSTAHLESTGDLHGLPCQNRTCAANIACPYIQ